MKTPYFVMPTEDGSARIFANQAELHHFADVAAKQLTDLLIEIKRTVADDSHPSKDLLSLAYDMSWQVSQAITVLKEGPDGHQCEEWIPRPSEEVQP
jgi:hypothetical protein